MSWLLAFTVANMIAGAAPAAVEQSPTLWTPAPLASDQYESSPAFTPDGREVFFMRSDRTFQGYQLLWSRCVDGGWTAPVPPPFAARPPVLEGDPFLTADGRRLYYISSRLGAESGRGNEDLDIWFVDRSADGTWSEPTRLPEPVNSTGSELLPRLTTDGRLLFGSDRTGGAGGTDIYLAENRADGGWKVENLGSPVNTAKNEYEAEISRDMKTLILVADRGDRSHLYRFTLRAGLWEEQERIPALSDVFQVGPLLSPDGDRLLFAQADGQRSGEIFLIDLTSNPAKSWPPSCAK